MAKRELTKQRRYRAKRIIQEVQKVKKKQTACHALYCEKERGPTSDRQKWKEELERYSRNKYQDEEMGIKAKKELVMSGKKEAEDKEKEPQEVRNQN